MKKYYIQSKDDVRKTIFIFVHWGNDIRDFGICINYSLRAKRADQNIYSRTGVMI